MNASVQTIQRPVDGPAEAARRNAQPGAIPMRIDEDLREGARLMAARQETPYFPPVVYIEPTNVCNCNCVICPRRNMDRASGFMSMDLFRSIIDQVRALGPSEIRLFNFGEPLLHPQLGEMIRYTRAAGLPVQFQTNGLMLNNETIPWLLDTGLDYIGVSVNGLTSAEYEMIRPGFRFTALRENVQRLQQMARDAGRPLHIHVNAQIMKADKDRRSKDIGIFLATWAGLADSMSVSGMSLYDGIEIPQNGKLQTANLRALKRRPDAEVHCTEPFDRLVIKWDGRATACCADYDARFTAGHIGSQSLSSIWNSREMWRLRMAVRLGRYAEMPMCRDCPMFYSEEFTILFSRKLKDARNTP